MTPAQREQLNRVLALTVFTLLLSVGVERADGWHNAPTVKGPSDWVIAGQSTGEVIASCEENTNNCTIVKPEKFPCYQKMQEAMRLAEEYLFWPFIDGTVSYSYPVGCDEVCRRKIDYDAAVERRKKIDAEIAAKNKWDAVIKECVK